MEATTLACGIGYITFSLAVMGTFLDGRSCACPLEVIRCALLFVLDGCVFHLGMPGSQIVGPAVLITFVKAAYAVSLTGALVECLRGIRITDKRMKAN
uniref:Uncharacterized protein n=2 Tax=Ixodes ricinus TaxID=34613 RepID=V5GHH6_IXORI